MNKIYLVNHCFDVDGGFGDAIPQEEVICGFDNREDANGFVEKYSNPHSYDSPYASLECGILRVEELNMTPPDREDMWWLDQDKVSVVSVGGQSERDCLFYVEIQLEQIYYLVGTIKSMKNFGIDWRNIRE